MRWGDVAFEFAGSARPLFLHWLPLWILLALAAATLAHPGLRAAMDPTVRLQVGDWFVPVAAAALYALCLALALANYRAAEIRLFMRARRLAGASLACDFSAWHLVDAVLLVAKRNVWPGIAVCLVIGLLAAIPLWVALQTELENPRAVSILGGIEGDVFAGLQSWRAQGLLLMAMAVDGFLAAIFGLWLWLCVHARRRHAHLCASLTLHGAHTLEAVRQRQREQGLLAEGPEGALDPLL